MAGWFSLRVLSPYSNTGSDSRALPFTCSWDPMPSADLSVGNPGSLPAFLNYSNNNTTMVRMMGTYSDRALSMCQGTV